MLLDSHKQDYFNPWRLPFLEVLGIMSISCRKGRKWKAGSEEAEVGEGVGSPAWLERRISLQRPGLVFEKEKAQMAGGWTHSSGSSLSFGGGGVDGGPGRVFSDCPSYAGPYALARAGEEDKAPQVSLREGRCCVAALRHSLLLEASPIPSLPLPFPACSLRAVTGLSTSVWPSARHTACMEHSGHSETIVERG